MILNQDVGPYSLRSLMRMARLKLQFDWDHTAGIVATILNARQGVKQNQWINPEKINPYRTGPRRKGDKIRIADMARGFGVK